MIARIRAFLRSLQVDLREREAAIAVGRWFLIHGHDRGHEPSCTFWTADETCTCGWVRIERAVEVLGDLAERADGFGEARA